MKYMCACTGCASSCVLKRAAGAGVLSYGKPASARNLECTFVLQFRSPYFIQQSQSADSQLLSIPLNVCKYFVTALNRDAYCQHSEIVVCDTERLCCVGCDTAAVLWGLWLRAAWRNCTYFLLLFILYKMVSELTACNCRNLFFLWNWPCYFAHTVCTPDCNVVQKNFMVLPHCLFFYLFNFHVMLRVRNLKK
jgi:hypothetical protein